MNRSPLNSASLNSAPLGRRSFLQTSSSLLALLSLARTSPWLLADDAKLPTADQWIPGKDPRLIVHSIKTGEIETPIALLREHAITPKSILFVRNNQLLENSLSLEPAPMAERWPVMLSGLVDQHRTITVGELAKLPQHEVTLVLQCSGNSRSRFSKTVKADGIQWTNGAIANLTFRGPKLADVLAHLGVKLSSEVRFVAAEGKEGPVAEGKPDFEHSLPLEVVLERTIIALEMNGESLAIAHGGPARLITPGYYATMNVKWLSALRFEARESDNYHHVGRYRTPYVPLTPGSKFESTIENSEPNWDMKIKSLVFAPLEGEQLKAGPTTISGIAFNGGQAKIAAVEVSLDQGATWQRAQLEHAKSPYAWHTWKVAVDLKPGKQTIQSRAVDVLGHSQPLDGSIHWNPAGYVWNGVDEVSVDVT
ncbi:Nitrate reductase (NADH) [Pirellula staleyi DSM 6068]|uniref:Nitrate reductase (NADH) n=1 Tax=Pirellula staleyi (strain ATCC 27377 / DSM 6068 / ICPB 4128) TaxID=530564 RepID=D2QXY2_PIRSD|nr:sulfite oxidase [Pirellula staleyi]ADB18059.1 Nitrate reductase (NADH) [Pirellula staleyi DSM 6068]